MYDNELFLPNSSFYRTERKAASSIYKRGGVNVISKHGGVNVISKHGGVLIVKKPHFETIPLVITRAPKDSTVACTLNNNDETFLLVCLHNPPSDGPYFIKAEKVIDIFEEIFNLGNFLDYVFMGADLNLQDVDWNT